jgi:hypothetical protein
LKPFGDTGTDNADVGHALALLDFTPAHRHGVDQRIQFLGRTGHVFTKLDGDVFADKE